MLAPILEELTEEYKDKVVISKLNVDDNTDTTVKYGIRSIPTLIMFKNGENVDKQIGGNNKGMIKELIKKQLQ